MLIPSFLAAYSGQSIEDYDLGFRRSTPLPNWQINYDGLSDLDFIKEIFNSFSLRHSYRSTYTASNVTTNLLRQKSVQDDPDETPTDLNDDLLPENQINSITISEQFAPFLGINSKLKNGATARLEYKRSRNLTLNLSNNQVNETYSTEWVIGGGYIIKDVTLNFIQMGAQRSSPTSNLELRADVSIRDNVTIIRKILEEVVQPTSGQTVTYIKLSADYQISKRVQAKLFYDFNASRYKTSSAFPLTTNQFGISVRLNLGK